MHNVAKVIYLNMIIIKLYFSFIFVQGRRCQMPGSSTWRQEKSFSTAASTEGCGENSWKCKKKQGHYELHFLPRLLLEQQSKPLLTHRFFPNTISHNLKNCL